MTEEKLWAFVRRANTRQRIAVAEQWLKEHFNKIKAEHGVDLWDDLMVALSQQSRQLTAEELGYNWY